jgi:hypothetical protein
LNRSKGSPEEQQQEAARRIESSVEELSHTAWDKLLATPEWLAYLDESAHEAEQERHVGLLIEVDDVEKTGVKSKATRDAWKRTL